MRIFGAFLAVLGLVMVASGAKYEFGEHPRFGGLAVDEAVIKQARRILEQKLEVPTEWGEWIFYYACEEHNATLAKRAEGHTCPVCGKVYKDERTERAWITSQHSRIDNACITLAQAWHMTGEGEFAAEVWRIFCRYAELTPGWGRHDRWGRRGMMAVIGGKRYAQSLDDAVGVIAQSRAYDLIYNWSGITAEAREKVERDLFCETADSIHRMYMLYDGKNNHMTWFNAAVAMVGAVIGNEGYLDRSLDGSKGFRWQMVNSVTAEGLWYEGTMAYHFYALQAVMATLEAARGVKADVKSESEQARRMYLAPLTQAYPNGIMPAINDSDQSSIFGHRTAYRRAAEFFDDSELRAFADGAPLAQRGSEVLSDAGLAYLRQWGESPVMAILDFGQHGGSHGHPDKMNLLLFAQGREIFPDIGRLSYSCAEYKTWAKQTVAHNTVVIGRRSQQADDGKAIAFGKTGGGEYVVGESSGAYDKTVLRRALILLSDGTLVDMFKVVRSGKGELVEWVLHGSTAMAIEGEGKRQEVQGLLAKEDGYQHLDIKEEIEPSDVVKVCWQVGTDKTFTTWLPDAGSAKETLYHGTGIGYALSQRFPVVIRSRRGVVESLFVAVHTATNDKWSGGSSEGRGFVSDGKRRVHWDGDKVVTIE